jgi:hypothetical protein
MLTNILSNTYTQAALVFAAFGGLVSDQIGTGYIAVIIIVVLVLLYALYDEKKKQRLYSESTIPIPLIFNISNPTDSKSTLASLFEILNKNYPDHQKNLQKYFNIIEDDLIFKYDGDIFNEKRFIDFLKVTKHDIKKIEAQTHAQTHFHIIYIGPLANAIMIGTMLGSEGVTLYQYDKLSNHYQVVIELCSDDKRENHNASIITKKLYGKVHDNVTIAIDFSSHKVALNKLQEPIIHLQSNLENTIYKAEDFIQATQEIYSMINELQQTTKHIKLVYAMPTTIAIMLGMNIRNYWDIELTQFDDGKYKTITHHLNKIKYYF